MTHKRYWFKAKTYGCGWTPATWEGWVVFMGYIGLVYGDFYRIDGHSHSVSDTLINFVPDVVILTLALVGVCALTGEALRWSWGEKKQDDPTRPS